MNRVVNQTAAESELQRALDCGELIRLYQPIVELPSGEPRYVEALLRWDHPSRGLLAPADFLLDEDDATLLKRIGWSVMIEAARRAGEWRRAHPDHPVTVSVNLSADQLSARDLSARVDHLLHDNEVPGPRAARVRDLRARRSPAADPGPRSPAPVAEPRGRDRDRRLRRGCRGGCGRTHDAAGPHARRPRGTVRLPARRREARSAVRHASRRAHRRRRRRRPRGGSACGRGRGRGRSRRPTRARRRDRPRGGILLPPARTAGRTWTVCSLLDERDRGRVGSLAAWPIRLGSPSSRCRTCPRCIRPLCA